MAKEGIVFVVIPFLIGLIFLLAKIPRWSFIIAVFMYLLTAYAAFFFRDPHRTVIAGTNDIVSPVDGRVIYVREEGGNQKIAIFLSLLDVHVTRLPFQGKIENLNYFKGKFFPAFREKASELNESMTVHVGSKNFTYQLKLIAGIAARRIRMWIKEGEKLDSGHKIGILMFGSRAEITFPKNVKILISKGDKVRGGLTLIGKIKR